MIHKKYFAALSLIIAFWSFGAQEVMAQRKAFIQQNRGHMDYLPYHFGFSLGFNRMDFALKPVESLYELNLDYRDDGTGGPLETVLPRSDNGFHIGIISNLKLTPMLDLRFIPTLAFGDRYIVYEYQRTGPENSIGRISQQLEATFIDFPIHLKFKSVRISNSRAYVLAGLKFSTDLSSNQYKDEGDEGVIYARTAKNDFHYELGVGFDHYFPYFKFSTEIKTSFGLRNLILPGESNPIFTNSIDRLNSRIIMISFLFE